MWALGNENKMIAIFTQLEPEIESPEIEDLYKVGTSAIIKLITRSDTMIQMVIQAIERIEITEPETENRIPIGFNLSDDNKISTTISNAVTFKRLTLGETSNNDLFKFTNELINQMELASKEINTNYKEISAKLTEQMNTGKIQE